MNPRPLRNIVLAKVRRVHTPFLMGWSPVVKFKKKYMTVNQYTEHYNTSIKGNLQSPELVKLQWVFENHIILSALKLLQNNIPCSITKNKNWATTCKCHFSICQAKTHHLLFILIKFQWRSYSITSFVNSCLLIVQYIA